MKSSSPTTVIRHVASSSTYCSGVQTRGVITQLVKISSISNAAG